MKLDSDMPDVTVPESNTSNLPPPPAYDSGNNYTMPVGPTYFGSNPQSMTWYEINKNNSPT
jgi:hypothetical protein